MTDPDRTSPAAQDHPDACHPGARRPGKPGARKPGKGGGREHGVAILMVLACLAVLMPFTAAFSYTTRVDWQAAINLRDEVTARNLNRGGLRLSLLLF